MKSTFKALFPSPRLPFIVLFAFAVSLPLSRVDLSMLDEGAILYVAERLTKGDVLYRDIATGIMPGIYYLQALLFYIFGYSVTLGRLLACATLAVNAALLYSISTHFLKKNTALLISVLFITTAVPSYWMAGYSQFSMTMVLLSLLFFLRYLESFTPTALIISGASAGFSLLFKQNYGVFITLGLGSVLLARLITKKEWKAITLFFIPFLAPIILTILYFWSKGALPHMVQYTVVSLFKKAANAYYKPYPLLSRSNPFFFTNELFNFIPFRNIAQWSLKEGLVKEIWIHIAVACIYLLPPLIIALSIPYAALSIIGNKRSPWKEITLVSVSFLLFLGVFPRSDIHHLIFILPPILITGALVAGRLPMKGRTLILSRGAAFTVTGLFSLLCLISAYMPLVHLEPGQKTMALNIPRAYGIRVKEKDAGVIRAITRHIKKKTSPDEPILVVPTGAMYYFLTGRKSAVPYPLIMPGAMDEDEVIAAMEETKLPYIIYSDMSFDGKTLSKHMPRIHDYITKNYHIDETYPIKETGGATYVLKRGTITEEIIPIGETVKEALHETRGKVVPYYDFVKNLPRAKSGIILGSGRALPLSRPNQVSMNAWHLKDAILQVPGRRWSKVYTAYTLHIPRDSALGFSIGMSPVDWHADLGDGALFEIYIYDIKGMGLEKLFSRYIDPKNNMSERRWFSYITDLKKYWGRDLIISFVTSGGPRFNLTMGEMNRWKQIDMAGWGRAELLSLKDRPSGVKGGATLELAGADPPGWAVKKMARFDDISFFLAEEEKHPGDYDVRLALGTVYDRRGKIDKAAREFRIALKVYPAGSEARNHLARYDIKAGKIKEARRLLAEGLKKTPWDAGLNMTMADLYRRRKEYDNAIAAFGRVLGARPEYEWARLGRARIYLTTGKIRKARADTKKVLETHPGNTTALILLGDTYRFKKDWKRSEQRYREALKIAPESSAAAYKLGLTLRAEGRRDEALQILRSLRSNKNASGPEKELAEKKITQILKSIKERN